MAATALSQEPQQAVSGVYDLVGHTGSGLSHDPIHMVTTSRANLKTSRGICIDCGWEGQYHIHYGTRRLSRRLATHGIPHVYAEFADDHSGIDYRMERSLPFLSRALAKS